MIYILDAYNVLHKMRRFETVLNKELRTAREALTVLCSALIRARGDIESMILVFDGRSQFRDLPQAAPPGIRLVFSETDETADERINVLLEELPPKSRKCVVSDDNFVRNHARAYGVNRMSVREFEELVNIVENKNSGKSRPAENPTLSSATAKKITEEYKKKLGL
ncbi:MAG: NYN domain-containing protein [Candidatus Omnitrophica bacterium]|nr:NYN domain-containing protein [Candidatus Omnitrophota bacterium]